MSKFITLFPGAMATDGDVTHVFKASSEYGGVTIIDAWFATGAATDAGTSSHVYLVNYGTSGTVVGGTIGGCGGTADPFAADTPKAFTLTAANVYVDSNEWVVLKKTEEGASSDFVQASLCIEYVDGIVTQA